MDVVTFGFLFLSVFGTLGGVLLVLGHRERRYRLRGGVAQHLTSPRAPEWMLEAMNGIPEPVAPGTPVSLTKTMARLHAAHVVSGEQMRLAAKGETCCHGVQLPVGANSCIPRLRREVNLGAKRPWKP